MEARIVTPGEPLCAGKSWNRGHGTCSGSDDTILSLLCGSVETVSRYVSCRPLNHRFEPEVGDIVVGRVREIASKKWVVDIGARQDAALPLSAIHLSGGDQRRRTQEDQLAMRAILAEGELLAAEVQSKMSDGSVTLLARSMQYGKLQNGSLVCVPASLVPRQKQHVLSFPAPLHCDAVLGVNGYVWLTGSLGLDSELDRSAGGLAIEDELAEAIEARKRVAAETPASDEARRGIAALRRALLYMAETGLAVTVDNCVAGASALLASGADAALSQLDLLEAALG